MTISNRIAALEESATLQVAALCQQLRAEGVDVIGLSLGEPDFPAPAHVKQAAIDAINNDISHYGPTPGFPALRQAIAASLNRDIAAYPVRPYDANEIIVSVGAKQALCNAIEALIGPGDEVIMPTPCWVSYVEMVKIAQGKSVLIKTTMENNFCLTAEQLEAAITPQTKLLMLCSPNNPTGNAFCREDILRLADEFEGILVVDEAYIDFAECESLKTAIASYPNIVVLQTLSKAWAMAGLRLGLALADRRVVEIMSQVKYPYNINQAALQIVEELLSEPIDDKVAEIVAQRGVVAEKLRAMSFVERVYPSDANFLLVKVADADAVYDHLIADGIIVRNRNKVYGCEGCLRMTIGTSEENVKLLKSLEIYEEKSVVR